MINHKFMTEFGDNSIGYLIELDKTYTIESFIGEILENKESKYNKRRFIIHNYKNSKEGFTYNYENGELTELSCAPPFSRLSKIYSCSAIDSDGDMDYIIKVIPFVEEEVKMKKIWARVGTTFLVSDAVHEQIKAAIESNDSITVSKLLKSMPHYADGESYLPGCCEDNPNIDDFEF